MHFSLWTVSNKVPKSGYTHCAIKTFIHKAFDSTLGLTSTDQVSEQKFCQALDNVTAAPVLSGFHYQIRITIIR